MSVITDTSRRELAAVLRELEHGPWRLIQLRGVPIGEASIDQGDVDFLATRQSVELLLQVAFSWVAGGRCHLRVRARTRNKTTLVLISRDGLHTVHLDLWMQLWQIGDARGYLRYESFAHLQPQTGAIERLPQAVEAALYLHHLSAKRKDLKRPQVLQRLAVYAEACTADPQLGGALAHTAADGRLPPDALAIADQVLGEAGVQPTFPGPARWATKLSDEIAAAWLGPPRVVRCVAVTGCDGSGKTTLARAMAAPGGVASKVSVGKRLYRNSLVYKLAVLVVRPFLRQGRERFDDTMAPWNYLRASAALRLQLALQRAPLWLIDRSLMDFLVVDRKTDRPRLHRAAWLARLFGRRIPVVHLLVPGEALQARKAEMTRDGQKLYDQLMFAGMALRWPTDYCLFYNGGEVAGSKQALGDMLRWIKGR